MTSRHASKRPDGEPPEVVRLLRVMRHLLSRDGCPWDREQTLESLKPALLEETYELLEAMDGDDPRAHAEELGDVLLQVVFQSEIRSRQGDFDFPEVAGRLADKLERRHPHVFGEVSVRDSDEVIRNWNAIKQEEEGKRERLSALDGLPAALPALLQAQKLQSRAEREKFDWPDKRAAPGEVAEKLNKLSQTLQEKDQASRQTEMGDILFSLVNLCRQLGLDAEDALRQANRRFIKRCQS